jgi:hypothetical protein
MIDFLNQESKSTMGAANQLVCQLECVGYL